MIYMGGFCPRQNLYSDVLNCIYQNPSIYPVCHFYAYIYRSVHIYISVPIAYTNEYKSVDNRPSHSWYFIWRFKTFLCKILYFIKPNNSLLLCISKLLSDYASERVSDIYYCYGWVLPEEPRGISDTRSRKSQPKTKMNAWLWWS